MLILSSKPELANLRHAYLKLHLERLPWHAAFTVVLFFFIPFVWPASLLKNVCIYKHIWLCRHFYGLPLLPNNSVGRDSAVGIATCYGLGGPGIESRWRRDFPHPSRPALGLTQPPKQWVPEFFPLGKMAGGGGGCTSSRWILVKLVLLLIFDSNGVWK